MSDIVWFFVEFSSVESRKGKSSSEIIWDIDGDLWTAQITETGKEGSEGIITRRELRSYGPTATGIPERPPRI